MHVQIHVQQNVYIYVYIYTYRERERKTMYGPIYIYIHMHICIIHRCMMCMYYIYTPCCYKLATTHMEPHNMALQDHLYRGSRNLWAPSQLSELLSTSSSTLSFLSMKLLSNPTVSTILPSYFNLPIPRVIRVSNGKEEGPTVPPSMVLSLGESTLDPSGSECSLGMLQSTSIDRN